jgi:predicted transcriptional regulator
MVEQYLKVEGYENLYRDPSTGAIINTEIPQKNKLSKTITTVVDDINNLKEELSEIKSLLKTIVENGIRS